MASFPTFRPPKVNKEKYLSHHSLLLGRQTSKALGAMVQLQLDAERWTRIMGLEHFFVGGNWWGEWDRNLIKIIYKPFDARCFPGVPHFCHLLVKVFFGRCPAKLHFPINELIIAGEINQ